MTSGSHDTTLVLLSILIAIAASYTALDLAGRVSAASTKRNWRLWLSSAAFAMGGGIWSMHFVAMLAFSMPGMQASYDIGLTLLSLVLAIVVTGIGFWVVAKFGGTWRALATSAVLMGTGIAGMHYTGMAAMRVHATLSYDTVWVTLSIFIAIGASAAALWIAFAQTRAYQRAMAAVVMGAAVAGMHYAGMKAASYEPMQTHREMFGSTNISQMGLAAGVAMTTFFVLALALVASIADRRFALLAAREAETLRASEERFRSLYRETPVPLFSLNQSGVLTEVSNAAVALLGSHRQVVLGRRLEAFMTPDSAEAWRASFDRVIEGRNSVEEEHCFQTSDGKKFNVMTSAKALRSGDHLVVLGGLMDITARKKAEAALRQSQKLEAVGQLTGGVAHDFNNLLAVVIGSLEIVQKRMEPGDRMRRLVDAAMEAGKRGASLTQRMLSFARRQQLEAKPVEVTGLVHGLEELLNRSIGPRHRIGYDFPTFPVTAKVDAHQLEIALLNLVVNSRDALGETGSIMISVGARADKDMREFAVISVADDGSGMDEETLARAADPFFTTKDVSKGTGLGLSMVHGFVEQSAGSLVIASEPGKGTTVEMWLPVADAAPEATGESDVSIVKATRSLKILAVDDDALVLFSTTATLEELGHSVQAVTSAEDALSILNTGEMFDAVITDQGMPRMTGLELVARLRKQGNDIPVLIASGYAELPEDVTISSLKKPFGPDQLAAALEVLMLS